MPTIGKTIATLLERAGYDVTGEDLKEIVGSQIELPAAAETALMGNLFNVELGKTNPVLTAHFKGATLNAVDKKLLEVANANGLSPEDIAELSNPQGNTYDKIGALSKKITDAITAKANAAAPDKKAIQETIDGYVKQIKEAQEETLKTKAKYEGKIIGMRKDMFVDSEIKAMADKLALPKEMPYSVKKATVLALMDAKFGKDNIELAFNEDGTTKLVRKDTQTEYLDAKQNKVTYQDLLSSELGENKLLIASNGAAGGNTTTTHTVTNNGAKVETNTSIQSSAAKAKADYEKGSAAGL